MGTTLEEECFQFASFENPLSFTEEEFEQITHSNAYFDNEHVFNEQ